jgi:nitroimidazol reductase NimA-like FMN-containing flavoprotein (pyridoxamine 5'-phosphate oxidase superfamily)
VVPVHFSFDAENDCVYSFSTIGQKVQWMRANPKVCLQVDEIDSKDSWTTVVLFGRYDEIHQSLGESQARARAEQLFSSRPGWWLPAAAKIPGHDRHDVVVFRIQIERLTGRSTTRRRD